MIGRPLLLIVDDDVRTALLLGRLLQRDGFDTEVAADGMGAIARLTHDPVPDALITDFNLPDVDGLVVGQHARVSRAGIPIIVVTGDPHAVAQATGSLEAVDILTKPLDYQHLIRRLRTSVPVRA